MVERKPYPSDVGDAEWALVAPYLTFLNEAVPQRTYPLREVFNALCWLVQAGSAGRGGAGDRPAAAAAHGIALAVVTLAAVKRGFVLLPRRWVVARSFGWLARFRRLARDYERLAQSLAGFHLVAFAILLASRPLRLLAQDA